MSIATRLTGTIDHVNHILENAHFLPSGARRWR